MKLQKNYFNTNLKFLRERKKITQTQLATQLGLTRAKVNAFENAVNINPTIDTLARLSSHFGLAADSLLWVNLQRLGELQLRNLEAGNDEYVMGTKIRVLATTVDARNRDNIEIVPLRAKAGYTAGYADTEYIESLATFQLPLLSAQRKHRMFQLEGDSMLPLPDKGYVIAEYVEDWLGIKPGQACIIVSKQDGIVCKLVYINAEAKHMELHSLNPSYAPYTLPLAAVQEVWRYTAHIATKLPATTHPLEQIVELASGLLSKEKMGSLAVFLKKEKGKK